MYYNYFSLREAPFSIAPDPRYLYLSERHREALAHLLYGVGSGGGFVLLTGEIGAGKTTVCRCFIEQFPDNCRLAYIFNPRLTVEELLLSVCDEFGIELPPKVQGPAGVKVYIDAINTYLLEAHAQGLNNVLVIDEAQNLTPDVLEQLRLLTNLETSERKLLQIILIGQPELRTMVERPELEQLAQRVIARYHLGPLSEVETGIYIAHRLVVAGASSVLPIPPTLTPLIHRLTQGVPRRINLLCDRALLGSYAENRHEVSRTVVRRAGAEVFGGANGEGNGESGLRLPFISGAVRLPRRALFAGGALAVVAISAAAWQAMPRRETPVQAVAGAAPARGATVITPGDNPPLAAHANQPAALRELASLWGQALGAGDPCQAAARLNLRCHQGQGGLYELRLLNRPAMVSLRDGARLGYAVLTAIDKTSVTLTANGKQQVLPIAELAPLFDGEYTTFWKVPRGFRDKIAAGDQGPDVDWIAGQLAQLGGVEAPALGRPLGRRTLALLRAFQQKENLKADGVAGPVTYMRLNQLSGVAEPRVLPRTKTGK